MQASRNDPELFLNKSNENLFDKEKNVDFIKYLLFFFQNYNSNLNTHNTKNKIIYLYKYMFEAQAFSDHKTVNDSNNYSNLVHYQEVVNNSNKIFFDNLLKIYKKSDAHYNSIEEYINNLTLNDLYLIYKSYYFDITNKSLNKWFSIHRDLGYKYFSLTGTVIEKISYIANSIVETDINLNKKINKKISEYKGFILLHTLGNNSREGVILMWQLYLKLIEISYLKIKDKKKLLLFIDRITFINSSAAGKATEINNTDGFSIQNIPESKLNNEILFNNGKNIKNGLYYFRLSEGFNLKQFGNPDYITVEVKLDLSKNKQIAIIKNNLGELLHDNINIYLGDKSLVFGMAESHVNSAHVLYNLKSKKFHKWLNLFFTLKVKNKLFKKQIINICKLRRCIFEDKSTNTGSNYQLASKLVLDKLHSGDKLSAKDDIWVSTQRAQQAARASSPNQLLYGFREAYYLNPNTYKILPDYMLSRQLIMSLFNLLKEFLTHVKYDITQKKYSHPLVINPKIFLIYINFLGSILKANNIKPEKNNLYTHKQALSFINKLWPDIEDLAPKNLTHVQAFFLTYQVPLERYKLKLR